MACGRPRDPVDEEARAAAYRFAARAVGETPKVAAQWFGQRGSLGFGLICGGEPELGYRTLAARHQLNPNSVMAAPSSAPVWIAGKSGRYAERRSGQTYEHADAV